MTPALKETKQILLDNAKKGFIKDYVILDNNLNIIEKDLEVLNILKKYIVYDKELNAIKCDGFVLTKTHRKEDYEKVKAWLDA